MTKSLFKDLIPLNISQSLCLLERSYHLNLNVTKFRFNRRKNRIPFLFLSSFIQMFLYISRTGIIRELRVINYICTPRLIQGNRGS